MDGSIVVWRWSIILPLSPLTTLFARCLQPVLYYFCWSLGGAMVVARRKREKVIVHRATEVPIFLFTSTP